MKVEHKIIAMSIGFGFGFWILDAALDILFLPYASPLTHSVLTLFIPLTVMIGFVTFGLYTAHSAKKLDAAKTTLVEFQQRYTRATSVGKTGVWDWNVSTGNMFIDPQLKQLLGYADSDIQNTMDHWMQHCHPDDREAVRQATLAYMAEPTATFEITHRMVHKDGSVRWFMCRGSGDKDAAGEIWRIVGTNTDITERKKIETALHQSKEHHRALVEQASDGIFTTDPDGNLIDTNTGMRQMLGYSQAELLGLNFEQLIPAEDRAARPVRFDEMRAGQTVITERRMICKDGALLTVEVSGKMLSNGNFQGIARDISERKRADAALRASEERHRVITQMMTDYIYSAVAFPDKTTQTEWLAGAFERITGFTVDEILAAPDIWVTHIHPDDRKDFADHTRRLFNRQTSAIEYRITTKQGTICWLRDHAQPIWDDIEQRLTRVIGAVQDITVQKQAAGALLESEQRFRRLAENARDVIFRYRLTPPVGYDYVNDAVEIITGYTPDEFYADAKLVLKIIHPDDRRHLLQFLVGRAQIDHPLTLRWKHKDGGFAWTEQRNVPVYTTGGNLIAVEGIVRDITPRVEMEASLRHRLAAEELVSNLASQFVNVPLVKFNDTIDDALCKLGNFFDVDYTCINLFNPQYAQFRQNYAWFAKDVQPRRPDGASLSADQFEWAARKFQDLKPLIISPPTKPSPAAPENEAQNAAMLTPGLNIPIAVDGELAGVLRFATDKRKMVWNDEDINLLKLAAEVFAHALARKQAEVQITDSLNEKEILLREVHHRVKNNLQVISSLLMLQGGAVQDENTRQVLRDSHRRVRSMALVHEMLYKSPNLSSVDAKSYVQSVTRSLHRAYGHQHPPIALNVQVDEILLEPDTAIPCGLIINELVSNALKHAFPVDRPGPVDQPAVIRVNLQQEPSRQFTLTVADNGVGLPPDVEQKKEHSLGLQLIEVLTRQINGAAHFSNSNGTTVTITFSGTG